jgi:hypothetical protein
MINRQLGHPAVSMRPSHIRVDVQHIRLLLHLGLQLGGPDTYGSEQLHVMASRGDATAVELLINEGVKFDNTTISGQKVLQGAVHSPLDSYGTQPIDGKVLQLLKTALLRPEG